MESRHLKLTQEIQAELIAFINDRENGTAKKEMASERASHIMRSKGYKDKAPKLSLSKLNQIVEVNEEYCLAEPYVTQEDLVKATLPLGKIPPVIAEFKKITVGGAIMGSSLESSSHKFGQFNDPCLSYELLLGDGSIVEASRNQRPDLFYGVSGSFGSLALLTQAKIPLIPVKPYVEVVSRRFKNLIDYFTALKKICHESDRPDFIEGLIFAKDDFRIITGLFVDKIHDHLYSQKSRASPWYHQYVYKNDHFTMSTHDYLFRYDRGAFWMGCYALWSSLLARFVFENTALDSFVKPFMNYKPGKYNQLKFPPYLFRRLSGWTMDSYDLYRMLHAKKEEWFKRHFVIQDFYIPETNVEKFVEYTLEKNQIYPLWICPCKGTDTPQMLSPHKGDKLFFDVGIYGWPYESMKGNEATFDLEKKTYELEGRKMFYSYNFLSEDDISENYPLQEFENLRQAYKGSVYPSFLKKLYG